jgi:four helix bundle protein
MGKETMVRSFRDLRVWTAAMDLVEQVYVLTQTFPKHEMYGLAGQMQRAAVSVPSNIAEGHTRVHSKEYIHHLSIARASLAELQTQLEIALRLKYCSPEKMSRIIDQADSLGRQMSSLWNALTRNANPQPPIPNP